MDRISPSWPLVVVVVGGTASMPYTVVGHGVRLLVVGEASSPVLI